MFSIGFILFIVVVFIGYYIIPAKHRYLWLLVSSYYFYASQSIVYVILLFLLTVITFFVAIYIERARNKLVLIVGIVLPLLELLFFKFFNIFSNKIHLESIIDKDSSEIINIIAPIGVSFYTLTSIGYVIDVYKKKVQAEHNFFRYALFVSFFPTIISGPIERSTNLLQQLKKEISFSYDNARKGCLLMLWGYCMKLLLANRLTIIVDSAFSTYQQQTGATMLFAIILYGIEIYVDFASYSIIVIGIGKLFGFSILTNFKQPYFSRSIKDFWNRWHISLSSWLRDYIYIPLGGNRKGNNRKYINLILTFLASGIWHGNGWRYIVWGIIHGLYQVLSDVFKPIKNRIVVFSKIKTNCFSFKFIEGIATFILVDFAWLFFRAPSAREAVIILKNIFSNFSLGVTLEEKQYLVGYDINNFYILLVYIFIILIVDFCKEKGIKVSVWIFSQNKLFRWGVYGLLCVALLFGIIYDYGIEAMNFIYTQF